MLDSTNTRQLAYLVKVDAITPMDADRLECAHIGGWNCVVGKGEFKAGDIGVYFEIDSKLPEVEPFTSMEFLASKHFKVKTQRIRKVVSQGLLMSVHTFGWNQTEDGCIDNEGVYHNFNDESRFLTKKLDVTYAVAEDNVRKTKNIDNSNKAKCQRLMSRHQRFAKSKIGRWCAKRPWAVNILYEIFGCRKMAKAKVWPDGRFDGVKRTDQERVENMSWVLNDKTPFIVTQKCDGSSGTYILERKKRNKFEFFVCSRNVRMVNEEQECFYGEHNYYWEVANKYHIEDKMRQWLKDNPKASFVCWQGEICAPGIQGNPHKLSETHFYCFHWTDSVNGRRDIREAALDWKVFEMETVPVVNENYILPDDFEDFKVSADGYYDASVCEGNSKCKREGYVYYKTTDPTFSFKNVSREYLLKH